MHTALYLVLVLPILQAYPGFINLIPNGDKVTNPCSPGTVWFGVGHYNSSGSGPRNPFGEDFAAAGHAWTQDLCQKDSDGDGKTNGQELGDPQCTFIPNTGSPVSPPTGHPGICEPVGSAACASQGFTCPT
uniref:Temptin Cys/Cys disulfide domain-containing protein n=1 Tax=Arion vulgaris TaxID=1028688 RepID=A0A0B6ZUC5_9EUPU